MRTLVVDDYDAAGEVTALILEVERHDVTRAASGEEALAIMARDGSFDILVTDRDMPPGMSGEELIKSARELAPGIGAVLMSGGDDAERAAREVGAVFLPKPFGKEGLMLAVQQALAEAASRGGKGELQGVA